jgi:hypothetical protein
MSDETTIEASATETVATPHADSTPSSVAEPSARPEGLPEKFNTWEDMAKSYGELSTKIGQKEEDLKKTITDQLEQEAFSQRPETAGDYQIPEVLSEEEAATNPLLKEWSEYAWENGYSQEEFSHWVNKFAEYQQASQPDLEKVKSELGDNANQRVESAQLFMNKFFPEEMHDAIAQLGTSSAGIKAIEHMQRSLSGANPSNDIATPSRLSHEDVASKMKDPRYYDPARRDKAYVQEVNDSFKKLYG